MPIGFDISKYLNPIYIETGTLYGGSAKKALEAWFERIYTVEIHPKYYNISKNNLKEEIEAEKVFIFLGGVKVYLNVYYICLL